MKSCTKCNTPKPFEEFQKRKLNKDGYHTQCKACVKIRRDKTSHREKAKNAKWVINNKDKVKTKQDKYRATEKGKESLRGVGAKQRAKPGMKQRQAVWASNWSSNNRDKRNAAYRKYIHT